MIPFASTALWDFRFKVGKSKTTTIILMILFAGLPGFGAAAGDRPVISSATVYVSGGKVVSDLRCGGLFSEQIAGTVQSGLPAVVELLYSLASRKDETVKRGIHSYELRYDVWEDVYTIKVSDSVTSYDTFDKMGGAVEALKRVAIVPLNHIDVSSEYTIQFSVSVHPLQGTEQRKIEGWVSETVRGRAGGSWREQVLNLNELVHRFFSREKGTSNHSEWYRTEFFSPRSLPVVSSGNGRQDSASAGQNQKDL